MISRRRFRLAVSIVFLSISFFPLQARAQFQSPAYSVGLPDFEKLNVLDKELGEKISDLCIELAINATGPTEDALQTRAMAIAWAAASEEPLDNVIKADFALRNSIIPKNSAKFLESRRRIAKQKRSQNWLLLRSN